MQNELFLSDLREGAAAVDKPRKWLSSAELAPLTRLAWLPSLKGLGFTALFITFAAWVMLFAWSENLSVGLRIAAFIGGAALMGVAQHSLFILSHEAAHYRLLPARWANELLGRTIGIAGGVSMCTYRVTHRLHHNHLYGPQDPDTAIHGGYPRGKAYLVRKLVLDVLGVNAWKTYLYFFGSPAINDEAPNKINPLNDTAPALRRAARLDRAMVVAFHLGAPLLIYLVAGSRGLGLYLGLWIVPLLTTLQPILRLRAICEHGAVSSKTSPLLAARSVRTSGNLLDWLLRGALFPHHVNYHLEHHLYPAVPHYYLPKLHQILHQKGALVGAEVKDTHATLRLIFAPRNIKI